MCRLRLEQEAEARSRLERELDLVSRQKKELEHVMQGVQCTVYRSEGGEAPYLVAKIGMRLRKPADFKKVGRTRTHAFTFVQHRRTEIS
jgi:hypothetical protein